MIKYTEELVAESSGYSWILKEKKVSFSKKGGYSFSWKESYYSSIQQCTEAAVDKLLREGWDLPFVEALNEVSELLNKSILTINKEL